MLRLYTCLAITDNNHPMKVDILLNVIKMPEMPNSMFMPVISISSVARLSTIKHIIFTTRLDLTDKRFINAVKVLQAFCKATLQIVYVNTPSSFTRDVDTEGEVMQFVKQHQLKNCNVHVYNDYNEENSIQNFAAKYKGKMIAMGTHGRSGLNRLMSGGIAENIMNQIDCPTWTLAEKK